MGDETGTAFSVITCVSLMPVEGIRAATGVSLGDIALLR